MTTDTITTTQVYRVYIKATPEAIWTAITDPEWTNRYGYTGYTHYDLQARRGAHRHAQRRVQGPGGGSRLPVPRRPHRRRGDRGRPAPPPRDDVADADGPDHGRRAPLHDHLRDQGARRVLLAHPHPRPRRRPGHRGARQRRRRGPGRRAAAAATPGSSATSSRCWRPAPRWPAERWRRPATGRAPPPSRRRRRPAWSTAAPRRRSAAPRSPR